jgi:hypothetical protein
MSQSIICSNNSLFTENFLWEDTELRIIILITLESHSKQ